jgi:hypothetical protein
MNLLRTTSQPTLSHSQLPDLKATTSAAGDGVALKETRKGAAARIAGFASTLVKQTKGGAQRSVGAAIKKAGKDGMDLQALTSLTAPQKTAPGAALRTASLPPRLALDKRLAELADMPREVQSFEVHADPLAKALFHCAAIKAPAKLPPASVNELLLPGPSRPPSLDECFGYANDLAEQLATLSQDVQQLVKQNNAGDAKAKIDQFRVDANTDVRKMILRLEDAEADPRIGHREKQACSELADRLMDLKSKLKTELDKLGNLVLGALPPTDKPPPLPPVTQEAAKGPTGNSATQPKTEVPDSVDQTSAESVDDRDPLPPITPRPTETAPKPSTGMGDPPADVTGGGTPTIMAPPEYPPPPLDAPPPPKALQTSPAAKAEPTLLGKLSDRREYLSNLDRAGQLAGELQPFVNEYRSGANVIAVKGGDEDTFTGVAVSYKRTPLLPRARRKQVAHAKDGLQTIIKRIRDNDLLMKKARVASAVQEVEQSILNDERLEPEQVVDLFRKVIAAATREKLLLAANESVEQWNGGRLHPTDEPSPRADVPPPSDNPPPRADVPPPSDNPPPRADVPPPSDNPPPRADVPPSLDVLLPPASTNTTATQVAVDPLQAFISGEFANAMKLLGRIDGSRDTPVGQALADCKNVRPPVLKAMGNTPQGAGLDPDGLFKKSFQVADQLPAEFGDLANELRRKIAQGDSRGADDVLQEIDAKLDDIEKMIAFLKNPKVHDLFRNGQDQCMSLAKGLQKLVDALETELKPLELSRVHDVIERVGRDASRLPAVVLGVTTNNAGELVFATGFKPMIKATDSGNPGEGHDELTPVLIKMRHIVNPGIPNTTLKQAGLNPEEIGGAYAAAGQITYADETTKELLQLLVKGKEASAKAIASAVITRLHNYGNSLRSAMRQMQSDAFKSLLNNQQRLENERNLAVLQEYLDTMKTSKAFQDSMAFMEQIARDSKEAIDQWSVPLRFVLDNPELFPRL